ncbi:hypothetical protein Poli38472_004330 [Pythium oligandrum]|uniref:Very long-chain fatty acid transport protein n=1 Tax=Pythium oligandrum TaxID=41045 RepID=A0A8K1CA92_PYTOL|nr:hypothetical protein Poli38472_004330 [Pythium oligandrum]|eukprot:TMW59261.1 hypothetical protein Poli38472_004330 [Pythium oligandrum]
MTLLAKTPTKLLAIAGAASLGYALDRQLLISTDFNKCGMMAVALLQSRQLARRGVLVPDLFEDAARRWPEKVCMAFEDRELSYKHVNEIANQMAHWGLRQGLKAGDKVALLMENRPEFVIVWLGLLKIGVVTALINTHLMADGLVHCIKIAQPSLVIVGVELLDKYAGIASELFGIASHVYGDGVTPWHMTPTYPFANSVDDTLVNMSKETPPPAIRRSKGASTNDMALLIYTSGTTGLPKAAKVNHFSIIFRSLVFHRSMSLNEFDRIYCALPLYHTSGGNLAVGMMVFSGATLCISRRFSTTKFWDEVRHHNCTVVQYIGEMCRYLMNAPPRDNDQENRVRAAFGNGMRPDVWADFQRRFKIPAVFEFYGSTEGVLGIVNPCTTPADQGHLGRRGYLVRRITGTKIVKFDVENEEHIKNKRGFFQECATNEVGELICAVSLKDPAKSFSGYYNNQAESNKKILRDVFKKGDAYFRTGDLFKVDEKSCWHFVDRIGDTFRWKGENVATNEVAQAISKFPGLSDICVYGVSVPGNEGRACLAAMVFDDDDFDMEAFAAHVKQRLPSYAMPLFLRQLGQMSVTGTMKYEKAKLRKEGIDPSQVADKLWYFNKTHGTYERLTRDNFHAALTTSRL